MANSSDGARWRRSFQEMVSLGGAAIAPLRRRLAVLLSALSDHAQSAFTRHFDGGYDPGPLDGPGQRGDGAIAVRNLAVGYDGEHLALEGVTGDFAPASMTAIVGPNGAGKSTLLKALAGIIRPMAGEVTCAALAHHRLAYLPQQAELDRGFPITVGELVALGDWRNFGSVREPPPRLAASVHEAVATVGLEAFINRQIAELSVGQFQRALFARLLLQDADVILLDEPFAALDESTTDELLNLLQRWREKGQTIVAVLHDLDRVRLHFPSTLLLARSPIAWGDTSLSLSADNLARAHVTPSLPDGGRFGRAA
jgi:zinc/manganese transport system ATP-binding protein